MKLRNKKTGDVFDFDSITDLCFGSKIQFQATNMHNKPIYIFNSLTELNEEWEDYEEPKDTNYWYIDSLGKIEFHSTILDEIAGTPNNAMIRKIIGNYFASREEAEKAVEKLKAWKRLKDNGFRFKTYMRNPQGSYDIYANWEGYIPPLSSDIGEDLNLLFGGEE